MKPIEIPDFSAASGPDTEWEWFRDVIVQLIENQNELITENAADRQLHEDITERLDRQSEQLQDLENWKAKSNVWMRNHDETYLERIAREKAGKQEGYYWCHTCEKTVDYPNYCADCHGYAVRKHDADRCPECGELMKVLSNTLYGCGMGCAWYAPNQEAWRRFARGRG
jgi:rubrerythrin